MQHPFDDRAETAPPEESNGMLTVPALAPPGENPPFPVIGVIAPVIGAGAIYLMTGSPFTLIFAALGPVVALAGVIDQRRGRRRQRLRNRATFDEAVVEFGRSVGEEIERRHNILRAETPGARELLRAGRSENDRWRTVDARLHVAVGFGPVPSGLRLTDQHGPPEAQVAQLRRLASTIPDAPVTADCAGGIGICGPGPIVRAIARGYLVQLLSAIPPERLRVVLPATHQWSWRSALPHTQAGLMTPFAPSPGRAVLEVIDLSEGSGHGTAREAPFELVAGTAPESAAAPSLIVLAPGPRRLPPGCTTIVQVTGLDRARITVGTRLQAKVRVELVTSAEAIEFAAVLLGHARELGVVAGHRDLWRPVTLADLWAAEQPGPEGSRPSSPRRPSLLVPVGRAGSHTVSIDLVAGGPHALVAGTTGSGKSELLVTWVTAMAAAHSPRAVTFLLVDFKGGAAFAPLAALPHCVGVITDLGRIEATRALESLRAEIAHREKVLHEAAARDISELPEHTLARLVVVVDEFAAMLDDFPDLYALFVDIAARGRSLGMHVILCTQRPAGVVRDALLANCNLRLSLRVNNASDSETVLGTAAAATLPASSPGACCLAAAHGVVRFMVATTGAEAIEQAAAHAGGPVPPRRPWLDPLPAVIGFAALEAMADCGRAGDDRVSNQDPADGFLLGVTDLPERQRQELLRYRPAADGNLVLLGAARTGKSTCLRVLAAQSHASHRVHRVPRGIEGAWDAVTRLAGLARSGDRTGAVLLLIDDLDSLLARIPPEYTHEFLDAVQLIARDGSRVGVRLVVTLQRSTGLAGVLGLFDQTIMLRMGSREEHLLAGGEPARWDVGLTPGGGIHRQHRVQLAMIEGSSATPEPEPAAAVFSPGCGYLVISAWSKRRARQLRTQPGALQVIDIADEPLRAREYADRNSVEAGRPNPPRPSATAVGSRAVLHVGDLSAAVLIGDADHWQSQPGLISRLRHSHTLVFDGCTPAEYRMIARIRDLPPLIEPGASRVWWLAGDADAARARWPQN